MSQSVATPVGVPGGAEPKPSRASTGGQSGLRVHRFEVWPRAGVGDPRAESTKADAARLGIKAGAVRTARVYLIQAALNETQVERVRTALLTNPVVDDTKAGVTAAAGGVQTVEVLPLPGVMDPAAQTVEDAVKELTGVSEVHAQTGVRYDFEGLTRAEADRVASQLLFNPAIQCAHAAPHFPGEFPLPRAADQTLRHVALRELSDEALTKLSREGHLFLSLDEMKALQAEYRRVGREPTDIELETLAQTWSEHCVHKTLKSRIVYREAPGTGDQASGSGLVPGARSLVPGLKGRAGHTVNADGSVTIDNLLKRTVAAATFELIEEGVDWTLSVFKDNSGVIRFDDTHAVCIKVETHNHPSAIEPYGGAATGVGGCIRDVIATGLGAQPIANTDVFCVGYPGDWVDEASRHQGIKASSEFDAASLSRREGVPYALPKGVLPPRRVLTRVVDGVRDYGNRMGIPTVNGAVYFDNRYVGNPLVFCGCIGLMRADMVKGAAKPGDRIIALGGRTGRDGIHGATFSSAELTDTHADEFSHAVQIGNAIEEKRTLDAIIRARDYVAAGVGSGESAVGKGPDAAARLPIADSRPPLPTPLFNGLTDCGAGGFSSAVGEMGSKLGAEVHLDRAPLKYAGLRYDEIWISESQERFVLAVPAESVAALQKICDEEGVLLADLGHFGTANAELVLNFQGREVGRMSMHFLHEGIPMPTREAVWTAPKERDGESQGGSSAPMVTANGSTGGNDIRTRLLQLLAHPNIASKRWIVRQYDHEVRGNTVVKPLVGPGGVGPGDASVIQPVAGSKQGLAIGCGMAVQLGDPVSGGDPYEMALAAVDECVRNLVCVGADPDRIAILDNFCWPSCSKPENLASLVRAAEGCYDAAKAYRTPFVSGKDSLNNQLRLADGRVIEIPPTLLITGMGVVPDVSRCVTMDLKPRERGSKLLLIRSRGKDLPSDGSGITVPDYGHSEGRHPAVASPSVAREVANFVADLIRRGWVSACHDSSEGGPLVAIAEMALASQVRSSEIGIAVDLFALHEVVHADRAKDSDPSKWINRTFRETTGCYVIQFDTSTADMTPSEFAEWAGETSPGIEVTEVACFDDEPGLGLYEDIELPGTETCRVPISELRQAFLGTLDW